MLVGLANLPLSEGSSWHDGSKAVLKPGKPYGSRNHWVSISQNPVFRPEALETDPSWTFQHESVFIPRYPRLHSMKRYMLLYFTVLVALFVIETTPWAQSFTVSTWTQFLADFSGRLMQYFDDKVVIQGSDIRNATTGYAVSIKSGCNGVEAAMILAAAILAYPAPWFRKVAGVIVGCMAIQVLNILRIISLYYLGEWSSEALKIAHLYVWPGLIILDALIIFLVWIYWLGSEQNKPRLPT